MTTQEAIQDVSLKDEAERRYLNYALSVITSRALPDVRDGLKPVQRRILYTMHQDLGLHPTSRPRKCAKIVGEVMGSYHPHGDGAIYEALVRMAQDFSMRVPLVDGIGNFGSVDGDAAAAYRYTEARLAPLAEALLAELPKGTATMRPNFDNTLQEPAALPAQLPHLLVNGTAGIAVGLATSIPPHNLKEVVQAAILLIDQPDSETKDLVRHVKGPDFPLGGKILATKADLLKIYETGSGSLKVQGTWRLEEDKDGRRVVIESIPYGVNKGQLEVNIGDIVARGKLPQVTNVTNESSEKDGVRIVLDLKGDADPELVMAYLHRHTALTQSFNCNFNALVPTSDGTPEPKRLGLKALLQEFLQFRNEVVRKRVQHELDALEKRLHILAGFDIVFADLQRALDLIRKSKGREDAAQKLMAAFALDQAQADAVVRVPLYRIAALEIKQLVAEYKAGRAKAAELRALLADAKAVWALIKKELSEIASTFGDKRRTQIAGDGGESAFDPRAYIAREDVHVLLTADGWVKKIGKQATLATRLREGDAIVAAAPASTVDQALFFGDDGAVFGLRVNDLPGGAGYGEPVAKFFRTSDQSKMLTVVALDPRFVPESASLLAVTSKGRVARVPLAPLQDLSGKSGRRYVRLDDDEKVVQALVVTNEKRLVLVSAGGSVLQLALTAIPLQDKVARGVSAFGLPPGDACLGGGLVSKDGDLGPVEAVTTAGRVHALTAAKLKLGKPGDAGDTLGPRTKLSRLVPRPVALVDWSQLQQAQDEKPGKTK